MHAMFCVVWGIQKIIQLLASVVKKYVEIHFLLPLYAMHLFWLAMIRIMWSWVNLFDMFEVINNVVVLNTVLYVVSLVHLLPLYACMQSVSWQFRLHQLQDATFLPNDMQLHSLVQTKLTNITSSQVLFHCYKDKYQDHCYKDVSP